MKSVTTVLRSIVADVEAMKVASPSWVDVAADGENYARHWFGDFEVGWEDREYYIRWPNLGILLKEAVEALQTLEQFGGVEGIKRCLEAGNDAPLMLTLGEP